MSNVSRVIDRDTPNPELQEKLRVMVDSTSLRQVSRRLRIGREPLLRYMGGVPMAVATLRGIEASVAAVDVGCPIERQRQAGGR
jgi:hypothetical protein